MLTILVTGFGAFPGAPANPTARLVGRLARQRRPDLRLVTHVFETRYAAVDRDLPRLLGREKPDAVILFGVAPRATRVRFELIARNRASVLFPDAGGVRPATQVITPGAPFFRRGRFPLAALSKALGAGGKSPLLSRHAGSYLCNYAYWHALGAADRTDGPRLVVFVHVPPLRRAPHRTLAAFERMARALIVAAAAATKRERITGGNRHETTI